jgi:hypothetical protein
MGLALNSWPPCATWQPFPQAVLPAPQASPAPGRPRAAAADSPRCLPGISASLLPSPSCAEGHPPRGHTTSGPPKAAPRSRSPAPQQCRGGMGSAGSAVHLAGRWEEEEQQQQPCQRVCVETQRPTGTKCWLTGSSAAHAHTCTSAARVPRGSMTWTLTSALVWAHLRQSRQAGRQAGRQAFI